MAFEFRSLGVALGVTLGAALTLCAAPVLAQNYPTKPIKFIAPYPPGGTTDVLARVLAQKLGETLGQPLAVENHPGAGGNIGQELAAKSAPDGYTLVLTANPALNTNQFLYKRLGFDPFNDYAPISIVATAGSVVVVNPKVPAKSLNELIALAKAKPGTLNFGSGGRGTPAHVLGEVFKSITGVNIVHVPYKGTIQAVTDLVAGQVDIVFSDMVPAVPQIKGGNLRALAVTTEKRSPILPDVPTFVEAGVSKPMPQGWWAVLAPKGTPPAIINRLHDDLAKVLQMKDVQDRYLGLGIATATSKPEDVIARARAEAPEMGKILKSAGVEPE
ncbi:MAG TPA: tripartite tricarboxylate transporter substrate binding protein [Burkholderiales bacterium]|nr:tripartite tricarboxylate transporter substrate binding protein [Burkholderiales bacterium]